MEYKLGDIYFRLKGITPCVTDNPETAFLQFEGKPKLRKVKDGLDMEEIESKTYRLDDGSLGFKQAGIIACMLLGASHQRIKKFGAKKMIMGTVQPTGRLFGFVTKTDQPIKDFELCKEPGRNPNLRSAGIMTVRPMISLPWYMNIHWKYFNMSEPDWILDALQVGGIKYGIGSLRPGLGHGLTYGTFEVEDMKVEI